MLCASATAATAKLADATARAADAKEQLEDHSSQPEVQAAKRARVEKQRLTPAQDVLLDRNDALVSKLDSAELAITNWQSAILQATAASSEMARVAPPLKTLPNSEYNWIAPGKSTPSAGWLGAHDVLAKRYERGQLIGNKITAAMGGADKETILQSLQAAQDLVVAGMREDEHQSLLYRVGCEFGRDVMLLYDDPEYLGGKEGVSRLQSAQRAAALQVKKNSGPSKGSAPRLGQGRGRVMGLGPGGSYGGGGWQAPQPGPSRAPKLAGIPGGGCLNCGMPGHIKANCPKLSR